MARPLLASVNGTVSEPASATIGVSDEGLLRGDGAFEVVRVYAGEPFALAEHLDRLERSAGALELPVDRATLEREIDGLLGELEAHEGGLRIVVTRGGQRILLAEEAERHPEAASVVSVEFEPNPILEGVKSLSYAANMQATRIAREHGADEAVLVRRDGTVMEAPTASVFWAMDGELHTPALGVGILASITRRSLLDQVTVREGTYGLDELLSAEEAFLASSTREVQSISSVNGRRLDACPGPLTTRAQEALRAAIEGLRGQP